MGRVSRADPVPMSWLTSLIPTRGVLPELPEILPGGPTPVLFLHGVLASPGNFEGAIRALLVQGVPVLAPTYGNRGTGDIHASLRELRELLDARLPDPTGQFDIIGHSLGGRLGLELAHHHPTRVRTLVGLGASYRGVPRRDTPGARLLNQALGRVGGLAYRQLMVPVPLRAELPAHTRVVSLVSDRDTVVPPSSAELGEVHRLPGVRHEHLPQQTGAILRALAWRA